MEGYFYETYITETHACFGSKTHRHYIVNNVMQNDLGIPDSRPFQVITN